MTLIVMIYADFFDLRQSVFHAKVFAWHQFNQCSIDFAKALSKFHT